MAKRLIQALILIGMLAGGISAILYLRQPEPSTQSAQPVAIVKENEGGLPEHPLMVEAIRLKQYPGSEITIEQEAGFRSGFPSRIISYKSDGLKIYALLTQPNAPKPEAGYPVVILNHGYIPPTQYRTLGTDYSSWIARLAANGFVVIKPDYRGHDRSEGEAQGGNFSPVYAYDVLNLVASLKKDPLINPAAIGMIGHSMGGSVSLRTIVASKDIKATVMAAGVVGSAEDLLYRWRRRTTSPPPQFINSVRQNLIDQYGEPSDNPEFWRKVSAVNYTKFVAGPVQVHHGTSDESVPPVFSETLVNSLKQANKQVEHFAYAGGDHNFTTHRSLFLARITEFFSENLTN